MPIFNRRIDENAAIAGHKLDLRNASVDDDFAIDGGAIRIKDDVLEFKNSSGTWNSNLISGTSMDLSYDAGKTITVDAGALTLTDSQTDDTGALLITKSGAVTGADTANVLYINSTGAHDTTGRLTLLNLNMGTESATTPEGIRITLGDTADNALKVIVGSIDLDDGNLTIAGTSTLTGAVTMSSTLQVDGALTLTGAIAAASTYTGQGAMILDLDSAAAFLVRRNSSGTSVFNVNTDGVAGSDNVKIITTATTGSGLYIDGSTITSGDVLKIKVAEGTMTAGGAAISVINSGGTEVFAIRENGEGLSGGVGEGTTVFSYTAGDIVITDGDLTISGGEISATSDDATGTAFGFTAVSTTGTGMSLTANSLSTGTGLVVTSSGTITTTGELVSLVANSATTATGVLRMSGTGLTDGYLFEGTGGGANFTSSGGMMNLLMGAATVGTGLKISTTGVYTGSTGLLSLTANSATTGVIGLITANGLTTGTALTLTSSGTLVTTGEMLSIVADSATTSTGLLRVSGTGLTDGFVEELTGGGANFTSTGGIANWSMGAATDGAGLKIATTGAYVGAGLIQLTANSATTGVIQQITANGLTTGTGLDITSTGTITTTGELLNLVANSATTSTGLLRISGTGLTDGWAAQLTAGGANLTASGGVLDLEMGAATDGTGLKILTSGVYTGTTGVLDVNAASATSGTIVDIGGAGLDTGVGLKINATAATLTTGAYLQANDGGVNVFAIGLNGHLQSRQTTKPTIAVTTQNGITAAAITAGSTDTCGIITTTGTNDNVGDTVLTVTFNKAYAVAPVVIVTPANASGAIAGTIPFVTSTTTTFVVNIPASASSGATPSFNYQVIEMGS